MGMGQKNWIYLLLGIGILSSFITFANPERVDDILRDHEERFGQSIDKEDIPLVEEKQEEELSTDALTAFAKCKPYYILAVKANRYYWKHDDYVSATMAQMYTESACNRLAKSWVGAEGLYQFMPTTAQPLESFAKCGISEPVDAYNPRWASYAAVCYNQFLYNENTKFQDGCERYASAMSGYNGGNRWVERKRTRCENDPNCNSKLWFGHVEYMPTWRTPANEKENRGYPRKVLIKFMPKFLQNGYKGVDFCKAE